MAAACRVRTYAQALVSIEHAACDMAAWRAGAHKRCKKNSVDAASAAHIDRRAAESVARRARRRCCRASALIMPLQITTPEL